jgi:methylated-DNA-protein-cysteine methyltransferase related protein
MRPLPIVTHEKRVARFQAAIQVHNGNAPPARLRDYTITGLENETANLVHFAILRYCCMVWHAGRMPRSGKVSLEMFLPPSVKGPRSRRPRPVQDNPGIQAIWEVVCTIPRGQVSTYGAVARAAGLPGRARLTGLALRMAPDAMNLPWHRVLGAGGRIVFPKSSRHFREQAKRLKAEGVASKGGRVDPARMADLFIQGGH